jgi:SGNH domain (fused to AT3 domains)
LLISAGPRALVNRQVLSRRAMIFIGLISYPLYLWHNPLLVGARMPGPELSLRSEILAVGTAFLLAFVTYRYVELPVRNCASKRFVPAMLCLAMAVCAGAGAVTFEQGLAPRPEPLAVARFSRAALEDWLPGTRHTFWTPFVQDVLELGSGPRRVLYVGDSDMQQYYPRISKVVVEHGANTHRAVFAVRDQCAPGAIDVAEIDDVGRAACRRFLQHAFDIARDPSVDTIVIAACWSCYFVPLGDILLGRRALLKPGSETALQRLRQAIGELQAAHKHIYIVLDIPLGLEFDPHQMIARTLAPPGFSLVVSRPARPEVSRVVAAIAARLVEIAQETGATAIDPLQSLCDANTCPAVSAQGEPIYHDCWRLRPSYVRDNVRFLDETILDRPMQQAESLQRPGRIPLRAQFQPE